MGPVGAPPAAWQGPEVGDEIAVKTHHDDSLQERRFRLIVDD